MSDITYSITIKRTNKEVFDYMDDVSPESQWQPSIRSARVDPMGPTAVGTRKSYKSEFLGREVLNTYEVKDYDEEKRVVYEATPNSSIQGVVTFTWEEVKDGTLVTMAISGKPKGVLEFLPRGVLDRFYQTEIEATLKRLKSCLESNH